MNGWLILLDQGDYLKQGELWSWTRTESWHEATLYPTAREAALVAQMLLPDDLWWRTESLVHVLGAI
jgi:hypothetical protein